MKSLLTLSFLALSFTSFASSAADPKLYEALSSLGVYPSSAKVAALPMARYNPEDGTQTIEMSVYMSRMVGSSTYEIKDVTLYESDTKQTLALTYVDNITNDEIVTKTKILAVDNNERRLIAETVKENAENASHTNRGISISTYSVRSIQCSKVVYPGAEASCSLKK